MRQDSSQQISLTYNVDIPELVARVAVHDEQLENLNQKVEELVASVKSVQDDVKELLKLWNSAHGFVRITKYLLYVASLVLGIFALIKGFGK